jgi:hypothetical protein
MRKTKIRLMRHLLSGVCIDTGAGRSGPKAYGLIFQGFLEVPSLLGYIIREVSVSLSSTLSTASLKDIACAAGEETAVCVKICCKC